MRAQRIPGGLIGAHSILRRVVATALAGGLALGSAAAGVALAGVPPPPGAVADSFSVDEDTVLVVDASVESPGLLANDNPGPTTCVPGFDATGLIGEVDVQPNGAFTYTPPEDFNGATSFVYGLQADGGLDCAGPAESEAMVTLTVNPVNDAPTAKADTFQGLPDRTLNVAAPGVLLNDSDVDEGDSLVAVKETNPVHGSVTLAPDGSFSYTPNGGYVGPDVFSYRASDGTATSPVRAVRITITAIPTPVPTVAPPTPAPTAAPTPTPEPSPTASAGASASPDPFASASAAPSTGPSPTPVATLSPVPTAGEDGLSIPVIVVGLLLLSLLAFGGAVYLPKWLERQRAGDSIDEGPPGPP